MINFVSSVGIFSVFRREALERSPLILPFAASDRGLLTRLYLRAPMVEAPEVLFFLRRDGYSSTEQYGEDYRAYSAWFGPRSPWRFVFPRWRLWFMDWWSIRTAPVSGIERKRCWDIFLMRTIRDPYMSAVLREDIENTLGLRKGALPAWKVLPEWQPRNG
jgi:hypothetical protein